MASIPPGPTPPIAAPPGPAGDSAYKSSSDACEKRLVELGMRQGPKTMVSKTAPSSSGSSVKVQTNVFGLHLVKDTIIHSYLVHSTVDLTPTKSAVFTKKGNEDFVVLDRREKCIEIFYEAVESDPEFFRLAESNQLIYDGQSLLFTTVDLFPNISNKKDKRRLFQIDGASLKNKDLENLNGIKLEVYVGDRHRMNFSRKNLVQRTADSDLNVNDRSLTQFLELVMNQKCIRETKRFACFEHGKIYIIHPDAEGYSPQDTKSVGDGKYLLPGMKKSVYFIEGPYGQGNHTPSLVVDSMKAAFHKEQPFSDKIEEIMYPKFGRNANAPRGEVNRLFPNFEKITPIVKGLDVYSKYTGKIRHLKVEAIHHLNAVKAAFDDGNGKKSLVVDYFREKYGIVLQYPNLNLLICKDRGNKNFFPMELMTVTPNQRVKISQQTSQQSQVTTKECAVVPFDRQRLIMGGLKASALHSDEGERNELLQALGLQLYHEPLLVNGKLMKDCVITYGKDQNTTTDKGQWNPQRQFFRAANPPKVWAVYAINSGGRQGITNQHVIKFSEKFVRSAGTKGIKFQPPAEMEVIPYEDVEERIKFAAENHCEYILMVTDNNIVDLHVQYKRLERELGVIIQDMTTKSLLAVSEQNKFRTLENIINKVNIKFGGINYVVQNKLVTEDQLIVGVGQSLSPPVIAQLKSSAKGSLAPTVIGYCSNVRASQEFVGDFTLATQSQDTMASMEEIIDYLLSVWQSKRRTELKRIVIYRTATSEGSYGNVLALEIPLIRAVIKNYGMDAKLIYIMVSKDHTFRFFKDDDDGNSNGSSGDETAPTVSRHSVNLSALDDPNIPSGVLVDTEITHATFKQFFLNSHKTLQGTAKTPMYTILVDDLNAPMDKLESLTYTLCHHHQIVSLATSLPAPLYIANEYAKRGRALWTLKTAGRIVPAENNDNDMAKLAEITKEIAYKDTRFEHLRVNA